jgi:lysophospholipase L1-like esterase
MAISAKPKGIANEMGLTLGGLVALLVVAAVMPVVSKLPGGGHALTFFSLARNRSVMTLADDENYYDAVQKKTLIRAWHFVPSKDFRLYRYAPNMDLQSGAIGTNRSGRVGPDRETAKPAHTWRIAVIGDSLATGYRIPNSDTLPAKLEERLNAEEAARTGEKFEVMSFACPGYSLPQTVDTALEDVPPYNPDAYFVELSERSLDRQWDAQLAQVVNRGIDPKYDFIRRVFQEAKVDRRDTAAATHTKLAPYRTELLRGALQMLQQRAASQHIPVILVLFPSVEPGDLSAQRVHEAHAVYEGLGLPVLDLTDAFDKVADTRPLLATLDDPSNLDVHPNGRAYTMLLDDLYRKLRTQPTAWHQLTGLSAADIPPEQ